jgi:hypothetical protein
MVAFAVYLLTGLLELWALLLVWGFSAGPVNATPFVALIGCLILMLIASPLVLFLSRLSALFALVGAALVLAWPAAFVREEPIVEALLVMALPVIAFGVAARHLWGTRHISWFATVTTPRLWVRVVLGGAPVILFVLLFNAPLVLALVWAGPPK